jgi:hypothetical protein
MLEPDGCGTIVHEEDDESEKRAHEREKTQGSREILRVFPGDGNNGQGAKGC